MMEASGGLGEVHAVAVQLRAPAPLTKRDTDTAPPDYA